MHGPQNQGCNANVLVIAITRDKWDQCIYGTYLNLVSTHPGTIIHVMMNQSPYQRLTSITCLMFYCHGNQQFLNDMILLRFRTGIADDFHSYQPLNLFMLIILSPINGYHKLILCPLKLENLLEILTYA